MKRIPFVIILLLFASNLMAVDKGKSDFFLNNIPIQNILKKYKASFISDLNSYLAEYFYDMDEANGSIYSIDYNNADMLVRELQKIQNNNYVFKIEQNFGMDNEKDKIAIISNIKDQFELLKYMQIQGNDFTISNEKIIEWFRKWNKEFKFQIIGIGIDFIQVDIQTDPKDYINLAKQIYSMCPDVVDQGTETIQELAKEMKSNKTMFFWWD